MQRATPTDTTRRLGFILVPNFSMIAFTSAIEPFRLANYASGRDLYSWTLYSPDGAAVRGSNGVAVGVDARASEARGLDMVFVCGGNGIQGYDHRDSIAAIRRLASFGTALGALCTGTYVLAKAGLLTGYRSTIHWVYHAGLVTEFPDLDVSQELFEIDRNRFTCAGGLAAADLALSLVARERGERLAAQVTDLLIHDRLREAGERQRMALRARTGIAHPRLLGVLELMERNIEEPLSVDALAAAAGLSHRQLERLFAKYCGASPTRHYLKVRLQRARELLRQTSMPILSVGLACGFGTASHFSKSYLDHFGYPPSAERKPDRVETRAIDALPRRARGGRRPEPAAPIDERPPEGTHADP
jgi:AraC family transcriptional regulator, glycine betaine-responsive activator